MKFGDVLKHPSMPVWAMFVGNEKPRGHGQLLVSLKDGTSHPWEVGLIRRVGWVGKDKHDTAEVVDDEVW